MSFVPLDRVQLRGMRMLSVAAFLALGAPARSRDLWTSPAADMRPANFAESVVEETALVWLDAVGYTLQKIVTIDWTVRENVREQLRVLVKRILRKDGYPPDKQDNAVRTVLKQAETLTASWL